MRLRREIEEEKLNEKVSKEGDTMTGALNLANNVWNEIGDDVAIGDIDESGTLGLKGLNGATGLRFVSQDGADGAKLRQSTGGTTKLHVETDCLNVSGTLYSQDTQVLLVGAIEVGGDVAANSEASFSYDIPNGWNIVYAIPILRNVGATGDFTYSIRFDSVGSFFFKTTASVAQNYGFQVIVFYYKS